MNINGSISLQIIKKQINRFLHRFHLVLFVIIVIGGSAVVVFMLNRVVVRSGENDGYTSNTNNANFDQATIKRIEELKTRDENAPNTLPKGRINPFVE
jgi:hypothetical protein